MAKNYCFDCKIRIMPKGWFMVTNQLWERFGEKKEFLCLPCFEKRINRKIQASDLNSCFVNEKVNPYTIKILKT
jgi:hypothetical protein